MKYTIIAAFETESLIMGSDNSIPWTCKVDLANFFRETKRATVVMGRKTFASLDNVPLKGRVNIVLSKYLNPTPEIFFDNAQTVLVTVNSFPDALAMAEKYGNDVFFIGGRSIYELAAPLADRMIFTELSIPYLEEKLAGEKIVKFPMEEIYDYLKKMKKVRECRLLESELFPSPVVYYFEKPHQETGAFGAYSD